MTQHSRLQGIEHGQALLTQGRHVAANATKRLGAAPTAEAAGDLLLNFHHANVTPGQTVGQSRQLHRLHL